MASEIRFRPYLAALTAFLVGCAVFVYDRVHDLVAYVGQSLFSDHVIVDHRTRLHVDSMERELRAATIELTTMGERFKAFVRKRHDHRLAVGDGYLNGECGWLPAH